MRAESVKQEVLPLAPFAIETSCIFDAVGEVEDAVAPVQVHAYWTPHAHLSLELQAALGRHAEGKQEESNESDEGF